MKKKQEPRRAYVAVTADDGTNRLGIATEGEAGYHRIREDADAGGPISTREEALVIADAYNEGLGLTKAEAEEIVFSSLFPRSRRTR